MRTKQLLLPHIENEASVMQALPVLSIDLEAAAKQSSGPLAELSASEVGQIVGDYRRFLELARRYPDAPLVPTQGIDEVWHLHMLNPKAYYRDCMALFGDILDHEASGSSSGSADVSLEKLFKQTQELWEEEFGETEAFGFSELEGSGFESELGSDPGADSDSSMSGFSNYFGHFWNLPL